MNFFAKNHTNYHFPKYCKFLLNHPVYNSDGEYWYSVIVGLETIFIFTIQTKRQAQSTSPSNAYVTNVRNPISIFPQVFTLLRLNSRVSLY